MNFARKPILTATATLALFILPSAASAFEASGNPVADALFANLESGDMKIVSVDSVSGSGADTTISGLTAQVDDDGSIGTLKIKSIVLEDASVSDGRISAGNFSLSDLSAVKDGTTVVVSSITASSVTLPSAMDLKSETISGLDYKYKALLFSTISIRPDTGGEVSIKQIAVTADDFVDGYPTGGTAKVSGFVIPKDVITDKSAQAQMAALGYDSIELGMDIGGTTDLASGTIDLHTFKISGVDMGTFSLSAKILGMTKEVRDILRGGEKNPQAAMGAMQKLIIAGLSIRFDNDSIVERALDMQAKMMGASREQLVEQLTQSLPLMLGVLQNPEFQGKVAAAVTAFLKQPGNLTAKAAPAQPVPVAQLIGSAMMAPQTIPTILNVSVTANQ